MRWVQVWINLDNDPNAPAGQEPSLERGPNELSLQYDTPNHMVEIVAFGPGGQHEHSALTWRKDGEDDIECIDAYTSKDFGKVYAKFREMVGKVAVDVTPAAKV